MGAWQEQGRGVSQRRRLELGQASVTRLPHEQISREHERDEEEERERREEAMQRHVAMAAVERGCCGRRGGESGGEGAGELNQSFV